MDRTTHIVHLLALETLALRAIEAFSRRGVQTILLKGPVTNQWLYQDAAGRPFRDVDLLIPPSAADTAAEVLEGMGFRNDHAGVLGMYRPGYESSWTSGPLNVDLHTRIAGIPAPTATRAWTRLTADAVDFTLHGKPVRSLAPAARIMLLGLHAARSGADRAALRDLETGLTVVPDDDWAVAANLATELDAGACFLLGVGRSTTGMAMLERIGFSAEPTIESLLLASDASQSALVVAADLAEGDGISPALVRRWLSTTDGRHLSLRERAASVVYLIGTLWTVYGTRRLLTSRSEPYN